jgi:hypothetical protein
MRMGGRSDLKTFQIYWRMSGVDVKGVTANFDLIPHGNYDNIVSIRFK